MDVPFTIAISVNLVSVGFVFKYLFLSKIHPIPNWNVTKVGEFKKKRWMNVRVKLFNLLSVRTVAVVKNRII